MSWLKDYTNVMAFIISLSLRRINMKGWLLFSILLTILKFSKNTVLSYSRFCNMQPESNLTKVVAFFIPVASAMLAIKFVSVFISIAKS